MSFLIVKIAQKLHSAMKKFEMVLANKFFISKFKRFGNNAVLHWPFMLTNPQFIEIENGVRIREYSRIEAIVSDGISNFDPVLKIRKGTHIEQFFHVGACQYVEIGENVLIAGRVFISDHDHKFSDVEKSILCQGITPKGKVIIEENAWLGEGCAILPGVTVGRNSVVGANSVVTKSIPPFSVAVGIPATVVRQYNPKNCQWERIDAKNQS